MPPPLPSPEAARSAAMAEMFGHAIPPLPRLTATKPAVMDGMLGNLLGPNGTTRRVSVDSNPGQLVSPRPEPAFSGRISLPRSESTASSLQEENHEINRALFLLTQLHGNNGIHLQQDFHFSNLSTSSSGATDQKPSRRNKYSTSLTDGEAEGGSAVGTKPWSFGASAEIVPSHNEGVTFGDKPLKRRSAAATAGTEPSLSPLPSFGGNCPRVTDNLSPASIEVSNQNLGQRNNFSTIPTHYKAKNKSAIGMESFPFGMSAAIVPSDNEETKWPTAGLDPLPFGGKPTDCDSKRRLATAAARMSHFRASEEKRLFAADQKPLLFGGGLSVDEFSLFIDGAIQML